MNEIKLINAGEKELRKAGIDLTEKEFTEKAVKYSLIFSCISALIVFALNEPAAALIAGIASFALFLLFSARIPSIINKRKTKKIEKNLAFALMAMSVELNISLPFEKILENLSENYGEFSNEIKKAVRETEAGASIQQALFNLSERTDSKMVKRSVSQIISIYEHGSEEKGEPIKQLAKEFLSRQKTESKEFTAKMVMYSVVFIVLSAIIPAMFQAFIIIGSSFMELDFNAIQVMLATAVVFPLLDLAVLLMIRMQTPEFLKG